MFKILGVLVPVLFLILSCRGAKTEDEAYIDFRTYDYENGTKVAIIKSEAHWVAKGCPPGYITDETVAYCLPYCENHCPRGYCVGPNQCACEQGMVLLPTGECYETCPKSCKHGVCSGAKKKECKCKPGYELDEDGEYCRPICRPSCQEYEVCSMSRKCECIDGFTRENVSNSCFRVCEEDCLNGICNRVGECECHPGFILKDGVCQANCWMDCTNGRCVSENKCKCKEGYLLSMPSLKCMPYCAEPCHENKICVAPNTCACKPGYKQIINSCMRADGYTTKKPTKCRVRGSLGCFLG